MGAEALQLAWVLRVAQLVATAQHDDFVQVSLVLAKYGIICHDAEQRVLAHEAAACEGDGRRFGAADGDASEYGILYVTGLRVGLVVTVGFCPLHDVWRSGLNGRQVVAEVQRQCAVVEVRCRGIQFLHCGPLQRSAVEVIDGEGQAERVPCAVLVEGAALEGDVIDLAVGGGDGGGVVGGVAEGEAAVVGSQGHAVGDADTVVVVAVFVAVLVVERLALSDVHGFVAANVVAAGLDEVGGAGTAEGDVALKGTDAADVAVGGDLAAVDGDVAAGIDAIAVDAGGGDLAAVDGDPAFGIDAVVGGGGFEGAGAEGLAVDG